MTETIINPKQTALFNTAKALFWKFGIKRVTIAEICKEAGVSKMTFYKFYENKMDIAKAIFQAIAEEGLLEYQTIMKENIPFSKRIEKVIQLKFDSTTNISQELIKDIYGNQQSDLFKFMLELRQKNMQITMNIFKEAAEKGDIRANIRPEFILYFLNKMTDMISDEKLQTIYNNEQELIMEITNFFFYGLGIKDFKS